MLDYVLAITLLLGTAKDPVVTVGPFNKAFCEQVLLSIAADKRVTLDGVPIERKLECRPIDKPAT